MTSEEAGPEKEHRPEINEAALRESERVLAQLLGDLDLAAAFALDEELRSNNPELMTREDFRQRYPYDLNQ